MHINIILTCQQIDSLDTIQESILEFDFDNSLDIIRFCLHKNQEYNNIQFNKIYF